MSGALASFFAAQARFFARAPLDPEGATDALLRELPGWGSPRERVRLYAQFVPHHVRDVLGKLYPVTRSDVGSATWDALARLHDARRPARHWDLNASGERFPDLLDELLAAPARDDTGPLPPWLAALARLEWTTYEVYRHAVTIPARVARLTANPTLVALENPWALAAHVGARAPRPAPAATSEVALVWRHPATGLAHVRAATPRALLALKLALEGLDPALAAEQAGVPRDQVDAAVREQVTAGVLLA